jgi:hypothetical protein
LYSRKNPNVGGPGEIDETVLISRGKQGATLHKKPYNRNVAHEVQRYRQERNVGGKLQRYRRLEQRNVGGPSEIDETVLISRGKQGATLQKDGLLLFCGY